MPLHYTDQLQLLKDLLEDHQFDGYGTVNEYEQIKRLIDSLMANEQLDEQTKNVLQEIYDYGQLGKNTEPNVLIENYKEQLSEWIDQIGSYS
ncbi:YtzH-like family protein [Fervidibacillus halotolerans]|uniref:YtzH-like family protein n=1 Tax=Fervidibacillus halotolerans TaxID=2980027 RepID=A0A9E8LXZ7_9BACI|nr:YtzH-like family protein [Fervidibacillus halotolerans]WAA11757.1 YtzH-like family protein [Fervidibacillus halotolerans]